MKKILYTTACLIAVVMLSGLTSCKTSKPVPIAEKTGAIEISLPFSGAAYRNSSTHFRAVQTGVSPDMATAKKIALMNARTELASNVSTLIKAVTDNYTQQRTIDNTTEFNNKFEELARAVVNQQLNQVNTMDEKVFQEKDGSYRYWVAIEMPTAPFKEELTNRIGRDEKLRQDYDKMLFEKVFNEEMDKLENQRP